MEPFGLLNLLKNLLPQEQEETPPSSPKGEETTLPPPETEEKPNACLDFLEAHERRAQRKK